MQALLLLRHLRRAFPTVFGILVAVGTARAQPEAIKFGLIDGHDLTAAPFVADSAAPAVVLCDYGRSYLKGQGAGFQVIFEQVTRTKVPADGRWVDLAPGRRHVRFQQVALTLDAQGGLSGKVHEERGGYASAEARTELASLGEKKHLTGQLRRHDGWMVPKPVLGQVDHVDKPLTLDYEFTQSSASQTPTGRLYLSSLSTFDPGQNPFRRETHAFAIDSGMPQEETLLVTLTLPAGYELAGVPKPAIIDLPNGSGRFLYGVAVTAPGTVRLTSRLTLRNAVYAAD